ncbi:MULTISPECIES: 50S ribosomal protein L6 [unclassified Fusibacter]|uniref:50S ribosomal protein L6 n=1 Tax=unclassified Fusibacter TaxID=2624464 RepID=UPI0010100BAF|nr:MULTISPECIES: 50S ribosomal protein L6 [unclassified Fusibacter]MCK8061527.1 50S ribosomal protein L6 [Fusibacter sp. A2]NPE23745.1 50S ribosomal protein L6 [Fusibacter sp. A1]RXV58772.1 50S ribosomal protein L6 [Fusibacter sp. A1]
MSRIGKMPIDVPQGVQITVDETNLVTVKGPLGTLSEQIDTAIAVTQEGDILNVTRPNDLKRNRSLHGLSRALIANMVVGVTKGYEKKLQIVGVGYRAAKKGNVLDLQLGFSHPVNMEDPEGITTECPSQTEILVKGINKQLVGNYASKIRDLRKPEPYKGKGVRYFGEVVRRKEGKTGK